jgi:hypothetical protein
MPVKLSHIKNGGILIKCDGHMKGSDIREINGTIYQDPEKVKGIKYQICNFLDVDDISVTKEEVRRIAEQDKKAAEINPGMLIAIVAKTDLGFGLSRMWEAMAHESPLKTMVFRNIKEAQAWIRDNLKAKP